MRIRIFIFFLLLVSGLCFSQEAKLRVMDEESGQAVPYASVSFKGMTNGVQKYSITSLGGECPNILRERSLVTISFVGYKALVDTIDPGESVSFFMEADPLQLEQVVITATRTEKALKDAPVITQLISSRQIESGGYADVQAVLEAELPGIEFQRHGTSTDINMQGLEGRNVLILIDGERMAGETRGNVDYSRLNAADIERIEIVKGAASALYGSQAMGAVINIISKQRKEKAYGSFSVKYGGFNERNYPAPDENDENYEFWKNLDRPNLNADAVLGFNLGNLHSNTSLSLHSSDGYQLYDRDSLVKEFIDPDTTIYEGLREDPTSIEGESDFTVKQRFSYNFNERLSVEAYGSYYQRHKYDFYREDKKHEFFNDLSYGLKASFQSKGSASWIFSFHSDTYNKYDYLEKLHRKDINYSNDFLNPKLIAQFSSGKIQQVVAGLEYLHESLLTDMFVYGDLIDKQASSTILFLQDEISPREDLDIVLGLRGGYHSAFGGYFTPKLSLMYRMAPLSLRLNYASGYRSPSLKELYMSWDHLGMFMIMGNEDLQPETNNYYSASLEFTRPRLNASLNAYINNFKNKIEGQWEDNQTVYRYQNIASSSLKGMDFLMKLRLFKPFVLKGAYSYVNDQNHQEGVRLSSVSPHTANLQMEYRFTRPRYQLTANISGKYIGAKEYHVMEEIEYQGELIEAWYPVHYEGYTTFRLSLAQRFPQGVNLVVGIENLFDYTAGMITFNTSTSPGRRYFVKLDLSIEKLYRSIHKSK